MSLRDLQKFLKAREDGPQDYRVTGRCHHGPDMWCGNCINFGRAVSVDLPNGKQSTGFIMGNAAGLAYDILGDKIRDVEE